MGELGQALRIALYAVEEVHVVVAVHLAEIFARQLVRHAARADDGHPHVPLVRLHRATDGLAQLVAAARRRQGMLKHVHGDGNRGHGPAFPVLEAQMHRHQESMFHAHLLAHREVELVVHERAAQVLRERQIARDGR